MKKEPLPYHSLSSYFQKLFGCRVLRVPLDAGFGCPNRDGSKGWGGCTFCDYGIGRIQDGASAPPRIADQMRRGIERARARTGQQAFLAYFQRGTGTYGPANRIGQMVREALVSEEVVGVSISTRPDCLDEAILDALQDSVAGRLLWIELGLPSAKRETLDRVNRGHDFEQYARAARRIRERKIALCTHVVFHLPGETRRDMLATIEAVVAAGTDGIKIHNLYVVEGTEIARRYLAGEVELPSREEYAGLVADVIERLPPEVVIHRLTGEGPRERVLAPDWCFAKDRVLGDIRNILRARGATQGCRRARDEPNSGRRP